jgi:hypothetical protein
MRDRTKRRGDIVTICIILVQPSSLALLPRPQPDVTSQLLPQFLISSIRNKMNVAVGTMRIGSHVGHETIQKAWWSFAFIAIICFFMYINANRTNRPITVTRLHYGLQDLHIFSKGGTGVISHASELIYCRAEYLFLIIRWRSEGKGTQTIRISHPTLLERRVLHGFITNTYNTPLPYGFFTLSKIPGFLKKS